jgi:sulfur dioxygenase
MAYSQITIQELSKKLPTMNAKQLVLDVRTPEEFKAGHIPQSRNIPYDQIQAHLSELSRYESLYIICKSGGRASVAANALDSLGYQGIYCVSNSGIPDWISAGFIVE